MTNASRPQVNAGTPLLVGTDEVMARLGVGRRAARRIAARIGVKLGNAWKVRPEDLRRLAAAVVAHDEEGR